MNKLIFLFLISQVSAETNWTILIYMDHSEDLVATAIKNLSDMAYCETETTTDVNIFVQLNISENIAIRYKVYKNSIVPIEQIKLKTDNEDLKSSLIWAFSENKSKNTALFIWGHGYGILEPRWDPEKYDWDFEPDLSQEIYKKLNLKTKRVYSKQYLSNYITNKDISLCLDFLFKNILHKKLDIIGFDTCMGAGFEMNYQFAPFVKIQIGSQNYEAKEGWNYKEIMASIYTTEDPVDFAKKIVESNDNYQDHTISAIDLSYTQEIKENLDLFIKELSLYPELRNIIKKIRKDCIGFYPIAMYIDFNIFFEKLRDKIDNLNLKKMINNIIVLCNKSVISNKVGSFMVNKATGNSIYFPMSHIDSSYNQTIFAKESLWLNFLNYLTN